MASLKSAWASIFCSSCCLGITVFSMLAMGTTILGASLDSVGNAMMVISYALLGFSHWRYWRNKNRTRANKITLALATAMVLGVTVWHFIM